jgi:hypothetical protein
MLLRVMTDAGFATFSAKDKYRHARPFMLDGLPISARASHLPPQRDCAFEAELSLRRLRNFLKRGRGADGLQLGRPFVG